MQIQQQLQQIAAIVRELSGSEPLLFDTPLITRQAQSCRELEFWGVTVDPAGELLLMDGGCNWHPLYDTDHPNMPHILPALLKRLQEMEKQYSVTTENL